MGYVFLTTPTSATGSYMRLMRIIVGNRYEIENVSDAFYASNTLDAMRNYVPDPDAKRIFVWNTPNLWNTEIDVKQFKFLVNFRDPRDLVCNQYYWALQHDNPAMSATDIALYRKAVELEGISAFVLRDEVTKANQERFSKIIDVVDRMKGQKWIATTYAQICLDFDGLVRRLCAFFEVELTPDLQQMVETERTENVIANAEWWRTTGKWSGHDFKPGRHRHELDPITIQLLNGLYASELKFCRENDENTVGAQYD